jgi:arylsulfatase
MDALVADGLRYDNMHTTARRSPSRSCMLTGRNHHVNHMAAIDEIGGPKYFNQYPWG